MDNSTICMHQSVISGRWTTMKRSLLAVIIAATAAPTLAEPIDATTPCSVAIHAFGSAQPHGVRNAGAISLRRCLPNRVQAKQGIWSNFSDAGKHAIAGSAVANCRLHPRQTIHEAADAVYRNVRDVHIQLGIVK
jgi:hypothetical protein